MTATGSELVVRQAQISVVKVATTSRDFVARKLGDTVAAHSLIRVGPAYDDFTLPCARRLEALSVCFFPCWPCCQRRPSFSQSRTWAGTRIGKRGHLLHRHLDVWTPFLSSQRCASWSFGGSRPGVTFVSVFPVFWSTKISRSMFDTPNNIGHGKSQQCGSGGTASRFLESTLVEGRRRLGRAAPSSIAYSVPQASNLKTMLGPVSRIADMRRPNGSNHQRGSSNIQLSPAVDNVENRFPSPWRPPSA